MGGLCVCLLYCRPRVEGSISDVLCNIPAAGTRVVCREAEPQGKGSGVKPDKGDDFCGGIKTKKTTIDEGAESHRGTA